MAFFHSRQPSFGFFENGDFREGTNRNFNFGTFNNTDQYAGEGCIQVTGGGGSRWNSGNLIKVDTSKTYQMIVYARTLQRGSDGNLAGGHIGFRCYDKDLNFIDLRNCGFANTYLSREASPGDSHIYITSTANWVVGSDVTGGRVTARYIIFYPPSHPLYSTPHKYTRVGYPSNPIFYKSLVQTQEGDWEVTLCNSSNADATLPNYGYPLPVGTPVSRTLSGGTHNYALGAPNYPETWTRYATEPFTGESRNSSYPFRFGTEYIQFLILRNYNRRSVTPQDHIWALDNIFFGECVGGRDYRDIL